MTDIPLALRSLNDPHKDAMKTRKTLAERFWPKVRKHRHPDKCWSWRASTHKDGYGWIKIAGRMDLAHRASWMVNFGAIPRGLYVLHKCDNPVCTNPKHLFLGTQIDNMKDMSAKGRRIGRPTSGKGERAGGAKLTEKQVLAIRSRYAMGGVSQCALAKRYGLTPSPIGQIINRITWRHI